MNTNCLWFVGQAGIALEIFGAGLIVYFAYTAKRKVSRLTTDIDHIQEAVDTVLDEVGSQFKKQIAGFLLLGLGLIMQFIGNFASVGG